MSPETSAATRTLEDSSTAQDLTRQISSVSERPLKHGGLADVWSAEWHPADGKTIKVALKALRLSNNAKENIPTENSTKEKFLRALRKEIAVWQKLEHENIQPFLGLYYDSDELPNMVSPWQNHGDINRYIRVAEVQSVAVKLELLSQVAQGLKYLHDHNIVHGDIKGANVLISEQGTALLADFGFSVILAEVSETSTPESSSDAFANGTYRFMAPEYCSDKPTRRRKEGDIWAYGCLFLEVISGRLPYYDKPTVTGVILALSQRRLPSRPDNFPDLFWMFFLICCTMKSKKRLSVDMVLAQLAVLSTEHVSAAGQTFCYCIPSPVQSGQDAFDNDPSGDNDHLSPTLSIRPELSSSSSLSPEPSIYPPPSPTMQTRSVLFPTSLALRLGNSDPPATAGNGLLNASSPTHRRRSSVATLNSADGSQDGTEPDPHGVQTPLPSSGHLYPPPPPTAQSFTITALRDDDAQSGVSKGQQAKEDKSDEAAVELHVNVTEDSDIADSDAAPFPVKPVQLAALLDPKSVSNLGGANAGFDGLGTDPLRGPSTHSLDPSLESGKDPLKASLADRKRVYGTNVAANDKPQIPDINIDTSDLTTSNHAQPGRRRRSSSSSRDAYVAANDKPQIPDINIDTSDLTTSNHAQPGQDAFVNDPTGGDNYLSPTSYYPTSGLSASSPEPSIYPPPSPTSTIRSVRFPTSLQLRGYDPPATAGNGLLNALSPTHRRRSSVATFNSADGSQDGTEPDPHGVQTPLPSSGHLYPPPYPTAHSITTPAVRDDDAQRRTSKGQQTKEDKSDDAAAKLHVNASDDIADAAPFPFKPLQLAALLDPKSVYKLGELGGASAVFDGLGTDPHRGLSAHSLNPSLKGGKDPLKASLADRKRVYGTNVLPTRPSKSLLQLMRFALQDNILILLSVAAFVSLALGLYEDLGQAPRQFSCDTNPSRKCNEPRVDWVEGLAIMIAILIVVLVGSLNDWHNERQFRVLNEKEDRGVKIIRDGNEQVVNIKDVLVGDLAVLERGEIVPCDGILVQGHNIQCDESSATGETHAIKKIPYKACQDSESDKEDCFLISGSKVLEGTGTYVLIAIGSKSFYGRTMMALQGDTENTPLQVELNALTELIAKLGSAAGGLLFAVLMIKFFVQLGTNPDRTPSAKGSNFVDILIIAITLIFVAVPEGLPLAVRLALAFATKRMTGHNLLVRVPSSCEIMANASVICTDKTGTLTQNFMTVVAGSVGINGKFFRYLDDSKTHTNAGDERGKQDPNQDLEKGEGEKSDAPYVVVTEPPPTQRKHEDDFSLDQLELNTSISPAVRSLFNEAICVNSTAFEDTNKDTNEIEFVGSKTEGALLRFAQTLGWQDYRTVREAADVVHMVPFSSERKAMGVVVRLSDNRYRLYVKGASEILTELCSTHVVVAEPGETPSQDDHTETKEIDELARDNIRQTITFYANQSLRTIALCYRDLTAWPPHEVDPEAGEDLYPELAKDLTLIAITGIEDPLRPGVRDAVEECVTAGVSVKMCTGDNALTARSIAAQCGIFTQGGLIMEGPVFRELGEHEMKEIIPRLQVLARSSPRDKQILVENLKAMGQIVAVTGDRTNDGPALKAANVGFSMGIAGTEVAKEASDIILMDDNFVSIVSAIMWGRCVNDAVRKFLQFQLSVNITAVIITFVTAVASGSESSVLSAVQLLWVNIIMDTFAALALATDPATRDLLYRKPDRKTAPLFTIDMSKQIIGQSVYSTAVVLVLHFAGNAIFGYGNKGDSENRHDEEVLKTLVFNTFVFTQIFNSINCRGLGRSPNVFKGILLNWYFMIITLIEVGIQILIVFIGGPAFQVAEITGRDWAISIIVGLGAMVVGAVMRLIPNGIFEVAFTKLKLIRDPNELPTVNWNPALDKVRENLTIYQNIRGGRLRGSSFVMKSRSAQVGHNTI